MIVSVAAQCASLANDYGASHGDNAPASFELALYIGDPAAGGVEVADESTVADEDTGEETVADNGYARITVANDGTNFPAADPDTGVLTTPTFTFPTSLAAYPDTVTHWLLIDAATGDAWDAGMFDRDDQLNVEEAGVVPRVALALFYSNVNPEGI